MWRAPGEKSTALLQNYAKVQEALVIEEIRERGISSIREKGPWQRKRNYMSERQDRTPDTKPKKVQNTKTQLAIFGVVSSQTKPNPLLLCRRMLAADSQMNVDCVDPLGRLVI